MDFGPPRMGRRRVSRRWRLPQRRSSPQRRGDPPPRSRHRHPMTESSGSLPNRPGNTRRRRYQCGAMLPRIRQLASIPTPALGNPEALQTDRHTYCALPPTRHHTAGRGGERPRKKSDETNPKNRTGAPFSGVRVAKTNPNEATATPNRTKRTHRPTGMVRTETRAQGIPEDRARRAWWENRSSPCRPGCTRCPEHRRRAARRSTTEPAGSPRAANPALGRSGQREGWGVGSITYEHDGRDQASSGGYKAVCIDGSVVSLSGSAFHILAWRWETPPTFLARFRETWEG